MKKLLLFLFTGIIILASPLKAQNDSVLYINYNNLDNMMDSIYSTRDIINAVYYIDYILQIDSSRGYIYANRAVADVILYDISGACHDFDKAKELGFKSFDKQQKRLYKKFCSPEFIMKKLKKQYYPDREMYAGKIRTVYTEADTLRGNLSRCRTGYDVHFYDLSLRLLPMKKSITGHNTISFEIKQPFRQMQLDLFDNLTIDSITSAGKILAYSRKYNAVFVDLGDTLQPTMSDNLTVYYHGRPGKAVDPPWQGGFVWKRDYAFNRFVSVACEHLGASSWWPVKDHLSDKPDSMRISMAVPEKYKVISNGNLMSEEPAPGHYTRYTWMEHYPMPSYDATFYCGNYQDVHDTLVYENDTLQLDYYVLPKHKEIASNLFRQSKEVLRAYTQLFGPYPFPRDGFALVESPYEGMEHQGAIAYGDEFKHRRQDFLINEYDYIIVHETAHEWWGNAVSFADMADAWISESFATYSELLFMEYEYGYDQYQKEVLSRIGYILNLWPMVGNKGINENSFAGGDIYYKGAIMLHNLRCIMNDDQRFMQLIRDFYQRYKYRSITTTDFTNMANEYAGTDLSPFFNKFLYESKPPILHYNIYKDGDDYILLYKWEEVEEGFTMPFSVMDEHNKPYRLVGTTSLSFTRIPEAGMINFINTITANAPVVENGITYYETRLDKDLKL